MADDLVHAALMRALGSRSVGSGIDLTVRLYATVTQLHRDLAVEGRTALAVAGGRLATATTDTQSTGSMRQTKLSAALLGLPLDEREALLLVALEGMDHGTAARILRVSRTVLLNRLTAARTALDGHLSARPVPAPPRRAAAAHLRLVAGTDI